MCEEDSLVSVCVVRGGENFITRIADVEGNKLVPPRVDYSKEFKGANRDKLYYNPHKESCLPEGHMGIWKWSVSPSLTDTDKDWIASEYHKFSRPIEVFSGFRYREKEELAALLRGGITIPPCDHPILILFRNESRDQAVLCEPFQLEVTGDGVRVKDDIFRMPCYDIEEIDLFYTQSTQGLPRRCLYRFLELPQNSNCFFIRSPEKAIKKIFQDRLSWSFIKTHNLGTRNEYKIFRSIIEALPENDLIEELSNQCQCSKDVADSYWKVFKEHIDKYVRGEDIETEALRSLLERDKSLSDRLYEEWLQAHQQELNEEENKLQQARAEFEVQRDTLEKEQEKLEADFTEFQRNQKVEQARIQNETKKAEARLINIREEAKHYETLGQESLQLVREKLSLAREEAAEFLADLALFGTHDYVTASVSSGIEERPIPMARFLPGRLPAEWETVTSAEEELEELEENLRQSGVNKEHLSALAVYLYGVFQSKIPLLLAGPQGISIANAISCTMTGRYAAVLDCCGEWDSTMLDEAIGSDDVVIIVKHPFQNRWIDHLLPELAATEKMWIFVHPYADDLPLEPSGMYQYLLPLVLDIFIDHKATPEAILCSRRGGEYKEISSATEIRRMTSPLRKLSRNLYLEMQVNRLMGFVCALSKKGNEAFLRCGCLLFSLAIALGRKDTFLEIIQNEESLEQTDRTFLEESIGDIR